MLVLCTITKCYVYSPASFFSFCCVPQLPFWKSTLLNQIPRTDYLMYSLYDQQDTAKDREQTERRWGEKQRERQRQKQHRQRAVCIVKPAACIVMHNAYYCPNMASNFRKQAFTFSVVLHYINKNNLKVKLWIHL